MFYEKEFERCKPILAEIEKKFNKTPEGKYISEGSLEEADFECEFQNLTIRAHYFHMWGSTSAHYLITRTKNEKSDANSDVGIQLYLHDLTNGGFNEVLFVAGENFPEPWKSMSSNTHQHNGLNIFDYPTLIAKVTSPRGNEGYPGANRGLDRGSYYGLDTEALERFNQIQFKSSLAGDIKGGMLEQFGRAIKTIEKNDRNLQDYDYVSSEDIDALKDRYSQFSELVSILEKQKRLSDLLKEVQSYEYDLNHGIPDEYYQQPEVFGDIIEERERELKIAKEQIPIIEEEIRKIRMELGEEEIVGEKENKPLKVREKQLSALEMEAEVISKTEALLDNQRKKEGQSIGE